VARSFVARPSQPLLVATVTATTGSQRTGMAAILLFLIVADDAAGSRAGRIAG
jgi:hypothetical protein